MSIPLIEVMDEALLSSGIVKSLHPLKAPLWVDGENVLFEDGMVVKNTGWAAAFTKPASVPVLGAAATLNSGVQNLHWGTTSSLYSWNSVSVTTTGTGFTGNANDSATQRTSLWSMDSWGKWCVATNGKDGIKVNKADGSGFVSLGGTPSTTAECLIRHKNYILLGNTTGLVGDGENVIRWPHTDDIEQWTPTNTNDAGYLPIRDLASGIIAMVELGDRVAAYSKNDMAIITYVGAPYIYTAVKVLTGIGAVSKKSVVARVRENYGINRSGIWKTDGNSYEYITPPLLRDWLQKNVNWSQSGKINGMLNEDRSLIEWGLPLVSGSGSIDTTLCYNFRTGGWTFKSTKMTAGVVRNIFNYPIIFTTTGDCYFTEFGVNADGEGMVAFVQSKPLAGDSARQWKVVDELRVLLHNLAGTGVRIKIGTQEHIDDAITWVQTITPDDGVELIPLGDGAGGHGGKFFTFRVESSAVGDTWALSGFSFGGGANGIDG